MREDIDVDGSGDDNASWRACGSDLIWKDDMEDKRHRFVVIGPKLVDKCLKGVPREICRDGDSRCDCLAVIV